jgi:hypothetical protein
LGRVILGWTIGEEVLIDKNFLCRSENCFAETETALFVIERKDYLMIKDSVKV